jgi:hypothetical protein
MYTFATSYLGFYHNAVPDAVNFYKSSSYSDDLAWAAIWLHTRTATSVSSAAALHGRAPCSCCAARRLAAATHRLRALRHSRPVGP